MANTYSLLDRADGDAQKSGELVDWHCKHLQEQDARTRLLLAATDTEIADLEGQLTKARVRRDEIVQKQQAESGWDAANLLDWYLNAPELAGMKQKSVKLPRGYVIGSRAQKALLKIVDPAPLLTALPECCELKLRDGDAKKKLLVTEGGVVFADTGELLPEGTVDVVRPEGEKYYLKRPDGTETELVAGWQPEAEPEEESATDDPE
jgi:hypothetical protein